MRARFVGFAVLLSTCLGTEVVQAEPVTIQFIATVTLRCTYVAVGLDGLGSNCTDVNDQITFSVTYDDGVLNSFPDGPFFNLRLGAPTFSGLSFMAVPVTPPSVTPTIDARTEAFAFEEPNQRVDGASAMRQVSWQHFVYNDPILQNTVYSERAELSAQRTTEGPQDEIVNALTAADLLAAFRDGTLGPVFFNVSQLHYVRTYVTGTPDGTFTVAEGSGSISGFVTAVVPSGNTESGSDVPVTPSVTLPNGATTEVSLVFDSVTGGGDTSVQASAGGPPPPAGFKLTSPPVYYEITTTAQFTGNVRVCLNWAEGQIANENRVSLFHFEGNQWVDITDPTSRDSVNNRVCGTSASLSPFTLFDVKYAFTGFFSPVDNSPTVNTVKAGAAVPVKFALGGDQGMGIFASGYPRAQLVQCTTGSPLDAVEETVTAGNSSLTYDAITGRYTYIWKTDKGWGGSCRELQVKLNDGEVYSSRFALQK